MMTGRARKGLLCLHLVSAVGWMGALAAYLALDVVALTASEPERLRACYVAMQVVTAYVIVPMALGSLVTGILISLLTPWGLFRHYWVIFSLALTAVAVLVLLLQVPTVVHYGQIAQNEETTDEELLGLGSTIAHSAGGLFVLSVVLILNVFKPQGLTPWGWRRLHKS